MGPPGQFGVALWPGGQALLCVAPRRKSSSNPIELTTRTPVRDILRSETMLLQENIRNTSCQINPTPRFFLCNSCRRQVVICSRCDRGQVYCGRDCALEVRRRRQREARHRYQASECGRKLHADRSRRFRARGRRVTDQGPTLGTPGHQQSEPARAAVTAVRPAIINPARRLTACHCCGHPVPDRVRMGPIHRPCRRVITLHGGPQARKRRQKIRIQSGANNIWDKMLAINLTGCFNVVSKAFPGMVARGFGRIVLIASDAAFLGLPGLAGYSASKLGVVALGQVTRPRERQPASPATFSRPVLSTRP